MIFAATNPDLTAPSFAGLAVVLDIIILSLMAVVAFRLVGERRLFVIVMLGGTYSLLSALFFVVADALDVGFTEAAVGAGISTVLLIAAMLLTDRTARRPPPGRRLAPFLVCVGLGAALIYASLDLPDFGDGASPANSGVGLTYIERTPDDIGIPNVVTAILASYRGFDTMGEVVVVFIAGVGVMLLLGLNGRARREDEDQGGGA